MSAEKWEEFEERMNVAGFPLGQEARDNIKWLRLLQEIGEKEENGEIDRETARKAAMALYEMLCEREKDER